jgi:flavin reductase (DIM6/NTAB) family NADH-FMN oxidoreductase RutF
LLLQVPDENGNPNLSPFSYFNVLVQTHLFSFFPSKACCDNSIKHTLINCEATGEVVINVVNFDMVQQTSLASTEYADGVNEFLKAGFTAVPLML